jgi:hypothetical protein
VTRRFLIYPFEDAWLGGKFFEGPFKLLRDLFRDVGVTLETSDHHDVASAEKVLFFNFNEPLYMRCVTAGLTAEQLVLFAFEPPVVVPEHGDAQTRAKFGRVFTHDDRLVDGERVRKLRYPQAKELQKWLPTNEDRRFLTLINANKYSSGQGELYGMRRQAIRHFESSGLDFHLYGYDWDRGRRLFGRPEVRRAIESHEVFGLARDWWRAGKPYPSYRGSVHDKYAVLKEFRFSICFENQGDLPGYITEKIFDCFVCGTVPIYLGAPNISSYLPKESFIDMSEIPGFDALERLLLALGPRELADLRRAGTEYVKSEAFLEWKPEAIFEGIVAVLA